MNLIVPHADYFYVGLEQQDEEFSEVAGLEVSWLVPPFECPAIASFRVVVGRRTREVGFSKEAVTYRPWVVDGLVVGEEEEADGRLTTWPLQTYAEYFGDDDDDDDAAERKPRRMELRGERFGATTLSLTFQLGDRRATHHLARLEGVNDFARRLAAYASEPVTFYTPPPPRAQSPKGADDTAPHAEHLAK